MKGKKFTDEHKKKISEKLKGNKNSARKKMSEYTRQRILSSLKGRKVSEEQKLKCLETKRKNGTFNISKPEQEILKKLKLKFEEVKYQYKSMEYPFECDFYIPMLKLYIEYQGMWVHGKKPYDKNDLECIENLIQWKQKINSSSFYKKAIKVWTVQDPLKRETARRNKLNWIEFFNINQFNEWYNKQ